MKHTLPTIIEDPDLQASFDRVLKKILKDAGVSSTIPHYQRSNILKTMMRKLTLPLIVLLAVIGFTGYYACKAPAAVSIINNAHAAEDMQVIQPLVTSEPEQVDQNSISPEPEIITPALTPAPKPKPTYIKKDPPPMETMTLEYY